MLSIAYNNTYLSKSKCSIDAAIKNEYNNCETKDETYVLEERRAS